MRPIRVTHLIGQTGLGGAERQLTYFLQNSNNTQLRHSVIVLNSRAPFTFDDQISETGAAIHQIPDSVRGVPRRLLAIARILQETGPDVVHSWSFYANPYVGMAGRWGSAPVLIGSMRNDPNSSTIQKMPWIVRLAAYRSVHGIVVNSSPASDHLKKIGLSGRRIFVVRNAVVEIPNQNHDEPRRRVFEGIAVSPDQQLIGAVGNLRSGKNHEVFIEALAVVLESRPDVRGVIIGRESASEPGRGKRIREKISELGLIGKVLLVGPREDVPEILSRCSVFCLTSRHEGMPNVVLEAMAAGCPVISTPVGDVPSVIRDGETGFLVGIDDSAEMASKILQLLDDGDLAASMGRQARALMINEFGVKRMAQEMEDVYRSLLRRRRRGTRL